MLVRVLVLLPLAELLLLLLLLCEEELLLGRALLFELLEDEDDDELLVEVEELRLPLLVPDLVCAKVNVLANKKLTAKNIIFFMAFEFLMGLYLF